MFDKILDRWSFKGGYKCLEYEYKQIKKCLKSIEKNNPDMKFLDVGHELCDVMNFVRENFSTFHIEGVDINNNLVDLAKKQNFQSQCSPITKLPFNDNVFDVVHCSHVIEHLNYPTIIQALEELFRVTKSKGTLIIRTPLENPNFFSDIDHIRPYPPESILNFIYSQQQQITSNINISKYTVWYCNKAPLYPRKTKKRTFGEFLIMLSWRLFRFPCNKGCQYGMIIVKE